VLEHSDRTIGEQPRWGPRTTGEGAIPDGTDPATTPVIDG